MLHKLLLTRLMGIGQSNRINAKVQKMCTKNAQNWVFTKPSLREDAASESPYFPVQYRGWKKITGFLILPHSKLKNKTK